MLIRVRELNTETTVVELLKLCQKGYRNFVNYDLYHGIGRRKPVGRVSRISTVRERTWTFVSVLWIPFIIHERKRFINSTLLRPIYYENAVKKTYTNKPNEVEFKRYTRRFPMFLATINIWQTAYDHRGIIWSGSRLHLLLLCYYHTSLFIIYT